MEDVLLVPAGYHSKIVLRNEHKHFENKMPTPKYGKCSSQQRSYYAWQNALPIHLGNSCQVVMYVKTLCILWQCKWSEHYMP